jgi:predicted dinucleotide-binding enzyme
VVKALNTVNARLMANPGAVPGVHHVFVAGNDEAARGWVKDTVLRQWLGWREVIDLGDLTGARGMEMYLPLWLRLMGVMQTPLFNISVVRQ